MSFRPRIRRQSYCRQCYNAYVREYRNRKRLAQGKPSAQSRKPIQRPTVEDIPDAVNVRIVGSGEGWSVAVRKDKQWICAFHSNDREEALLLLGAIVRSPIAMRTHPASYARPAETRPAVPSSGMFFNVTLGSPVSCILSPRCAAIPLGRITVWTTRVTRFVEQHQPRPR